MNLTECSALISGGGGGLGGATARRLVELGASVVLFDPVIEKAEELASELGDRATAIKGDRQTETGVSR